MSVINYITQCKDCLELAIANTVTSLELKVFAMTS